MLYFKLIAAVAPAVVLAMIIINRDRQRPEPRRWLFGATGLGVVAGVIVIMLGMTVFEPIEIDSFFAAFFDAFVTAAVPEEALKFAMLCVIASRCRHFDEYFDGIVYAVCIGMGFAGFENMLYLFGEDDWIALGVSRALLAVPAHYFFAVIMGAFFAKARFDRQNSGLYMPLALLLPIMAHGIYDFLCFSMSIDEDLSLLLMLCFLAGFKWIRRYTRRLVDTTLSLDL